MQRKTIALLGLALLFFFSISVLSSGNAFAQSPIHFVKQIDNGPDSDRFNFVVAGEGYREQDRALFYDDIDRLITKGMLGHDVFGQNFKAFNLYVAETWSKSDGPSLPNQPKKDTAFDITFSDSDWSNYFGQWMKNDKTMQRFRDCRTYCPTLPNRIILLVNTHGKGWGGETYHNYITIISTGIDWQTIQHEMGHSIAGLWDEYVVDAKSVYNDEPFADKNASTFGGRYDVPWSSFVDPSTPVPTPFYVHPKNGIGIYVGGFCYGKGTYRPSLTCRMNLNETDYCAYCKSIITKIVTSHNPDVKTPFLFPQTTFSPVNLANNASREIPFQITSTSLVHNEPAPLPFSDITIDGPQSVILAETYDKTGTQKSRVVSNPFLLRSIPPPSKRGHVKELLRQIATPYLSTYIPASYDPVKNGYGIRLYEVSLTPGNKQSRQTVAAIKKKSSPSDFGQVALKIPSPTKASVQGGDILATVNDSPVSKGKLLLDLRAK